MIIKLDKGIPLPPRVKTGRATKYPWKDMEVGDSFFVPGGPGVDHSLRTSASHRGRLDACKYAVRKVANGFRVWRTS